MIPFHLAELAAQKAATVTDQAMQSTKICGVSLYGLAKLVLIMVAAQVDYMIALYAEATDATIMVKIM